MARLSFLIQYSLIFIILVGILLFCPESYAAQVDGHDRSGHNAALTQGRKGSRSGHHRRALYYGHNQSGHKYYIDNPDGFPGGGSQSLGGNQQGTTTVNPTTDSSIFTEKLVTTQQPASTAPTTTTPQTTPEQTSVKPTTTDLTFTNSQTTLHLTTTTLATTTATTNPTTTTTVTTAATTTTTTETTTETTTTLHTTTETSLTISSTTSTPSPTTSVLIGQCASDPAATNGQCPSPQVCNTTTNTCEMTTTCASDSNCTSSQSCVNNTCQAIATPQRSSSTLSDGAIAAIITCVLVGVTIIAGAIFYYYRRKGRRETTRLSNFSPHQLLEDDDFFDEPHAQTTNPEDPIPTPTDEAFVVRSPEMSETAWAAPMPPPASFSTMGTNPSVATVIPTTEAALVENDKTLVDPESTGMTHQPLTIPVSGVQSPPIMTPTDGISVNSNIPRHTNLSFLDMSQPGLQYFSSDDSFYDPQSAHRQSWTTDGQSAPSIMSRNSMFQRESTGSTLASPWANHNRGLWDDGLASGRGRGRGKSQKNASSFLTEVAEDSSVFTPSTYGHLSDNLSAADGQKQ